MAWEFKSLSRYQILLRGYSVRCNPLNFALASFGSFYASPWYEIKNASVPLPLLHERAGFKLRESRLTQVCPHMYANHQGIFLGEKMSLTPVCERGSRN